LSHTSSSFWHGYFADRVSWTIYLGLLWMSFLPISATQVARITGMSHRHLTTSTWHVFSDTVTLPTKFKRLWICSGNCIFLGWLNILCKTSGFKYDKLEN
jgi:hypothetical protein